MESLLNSTVITDLLSKITPLTPAEVEDFLKAVVNVEDFRALLNSTAAGQ